MKICIDSDATGREMRCIMAAMVRQLGHHLMDLNSPDGDQYPEIATRLAKRVAHGDFERGILVCGSGLGMAMAANKVRGVFAGTPQNVDTARKMAESNNAQIITVGCEVLGHYEPYLIVQAYLGTAFAERRNAARMRELELQQ